MSRHHEHLNFPAETLGALLRLLSRGPRVHARVVSFLTTHSKLVACHTRARVDPRAFFFKFPPTERLARIIVLAGALHPGEKLFYRQYLPVFIVLTLKKKTMSQFVYNRRFPAQASAGVGLRTGERD
jgi:hypothetical protein